MMKKTKPSSILLISVVLILIGFLSNNASAQAKKKVLFLGNSYTAYNNLPQLVADVALSGVLRGNVVLARGDHSGQAKPCISDLQRVTCPFQSCALRVELIHGQTVVKHPSIVIFRGQDHAPVGSLMITSHPWRPAWSAWGWASPSASPPPIARASIVRWSRCLI